MPILLKVSDRNNIPGDRIPLIKKCNIVVYFILQRCCKIYLCGMKYPVIALISLLSITRAQAQAPHAENRPGTDSSRSLDQVVVTASRSAQRLKDVPQKIEVITSKDIAATPALDMTDILKKTAAVNVIQYPGLESGVGIRGFRPEFDGLNQHTLLLINGRPAGTTNLGLIDLSNVDHVEVLKGPASALYGSQAMGGVINIIPLLSSGPVKGNVYADYGSYNTYQFGGHAGGNLTQRLDFDVSGMYFDRASNFRIGDGNLFRRMLGSSHALNVYSNGRDSVVNDKGADGTKRPYTEYTYYTTSARVGYKLSRDWRLDASGSVFIADHVQTPGDIFSGNTGDALKDAHRHNSELALTGREGNNELSARVYYGDERTKYIAIQDYLGNPLDTSYVDYKTDYVWYGLQLKDAISLGSQKLIVGYDYNHAASKALSYDQPVDGVQNETAYSPNASLVTNGFYAQGQFSLLEGRLRVNPGIRLDITGFSIQHTPGLQETLYTASKTNDFVSPSLSAQYTLAKGLAVHGSIGRAFVTPDPASVAGYAVSGQGTGQVDVTQGNPNLKNESSLSEELGLKYESLPTGIRADVTYFTTDVSNRVATLSEPPSIPYSIGSDNVASVTTYYNADKSHIRGFEVMGSYDFGALSGYRYSLRIFTNITSSFKAVDITENKGQPTTAQIQNVAKANVTYGVEYSTRKKWTTRLTGRYVGQRWDTDFNNVEQPLVRYPSFMVLDWSASYLVATHHRLTLTLANLTDENYYEKRGYNLSGRSFSLRYSWSFGGQQKK
jgi:outer membrane receptor for ferrienterochelin and colicin